MTTAATTTSDLERLYRKFADGDHSIFSPSAASRWLNCPGSLIPNLLAQDNTGFHAAEGTVAHSLAEEWLLTGKKPVHRIGTYEWIDNGTDWFEILIDRAMISYVEQYVDWCLMTPGDVLIESRVDFSHIMPVPRQKGTLDFCAVTRSTLFIKDLKYGKGVAVSAVRNPQLMIYAIAMLKWLADNFGYWPKKVVLGIGQPRLEVFEEWEITPEELVGFGETVKKKAKVAWDINAPRVAGEKQCVFCRVRSECPALAKMAQEVTALRFPEDGCKITGSQSESLIEDIEADLYYLDFKLPKSLGTMHLAKLLHYRRPLENWFKSLEFELRRRATLGQEIPGYKMVEGRSSRSFPDEDIAENTLIENGVNPEDLRITTFVSPAQAEDLLRGAGVRPKELPGILEPITRKQRGAPTLAPLSDKRPVFGSDYKQAMENDDFEE